MLISARSMRAIMTMVVFSRQSDKDDYKKSSVNWLNITIISMASPPMANPKPARQS